MTSLATARASCSSAAPSAPGVQQDRRRSACAWGVAAAGGWQEGEGSAVPTQPHRLAFFVTGRAHPLHLLLVTKPVVLDSTGCDEALFHLPGLAREAAVGEQQRRRRSHKTLQDARPPGLYTQSEAPANRWEQRFCMGGVARELQFRSVGVLIFFLGCPPIDPVQMRALQSSSLSAAQRPRPSTWTSRTRRIWLLSPWWQ